MPTPTEDYAPGVFIRKKEFANGGHVYNVDVSRVKDFADWIMRNANSDRLRLKISQRREAPANDKSPTHTMVVDRWVPQGGHGQSATRAPSAPPPPARPEAPRAATPPPPPMGGPDQDTDFFQPETGDDVPF